MFYRLPPFSNSPLLEFCSSSNMAFNPSFETRRKVSTTATHIEQDASLSSESRNSWVVFDPQEQASYDILSFSTNDRLTSSLDDEEDTGEIAESDGLHLRRAGQLLTVTHEDSQEDDDLIEDIHLSLSNRIDEWQKAKDASVSDNIASWDLDSDLVNQMLDTSILQRVPAFYGDKLFESMSKSDYAGFKQASMRLKDSLTRNGYDSSDPDILSHLFSLLQWLTLLQGSGLINDYIANTLSRVHIKCPSYAPEFSDTATSSSMVKCGGSSWNDI